jgi:DNA-binding transcriptional regulator YiaG
MQEQNPESDRGGSVDWPPERIKSIRKTLNMTQKAFALEVGVHVVTVIRWEGGGFKPSGLALQHLERLEGLANKVP